MTSEPYDGKGSQWDFDAEQALDPVMRKAIEWFTLLSDGQASDEAVLAHQCWLMAAPEHAQAYNKAQTLWSGVRQIHALQKTPK